MAVYQATGTSTNPVAMASSNMTQSLVGGTSVTRVCWSFTITGSGTTYYFYMVTFSGTNLAAKSDLLNYLSNNSGGYLLFCPQAISGPKIIMTVSISGTTITFNNVGLTLNTDNLGNITRAASEYWNTLYTLGAQ